MKVIRHLGHGDTSPPIYGLLDEKGGECKVRGLYLSKNLGKWINTIIENEGIYSSPCYDFHKTYEVLIEYEHYTELVGYKYKYPELFI